MTDNEFVTETINRIKLIQSYREKYGERDINEYYKTNGTWQDIEEYFRKCIEKNN